MSSHFMHALYKARRSHRVMACLVLWGVLGTGLPDEVHAQRATASSSVDGSTPAPALSSAETVATVAAVPAQLSAEIHGVVADPSGDLVPGAVVTLEHEKSSEVRTTQAAGDGTFSFLRVASGPYRLSVTASGFKPFMAIGTLTEGQTLTLPDIALPISTITTEIEVSASRHEIAAAQLGLQEQQRVLGVFPNFYASYIWDAEPLSAGQKFSLAWKFSTDPVAFGMAGFIAGTEQAEDSFAGYGQGSRGYAKRLGAIYADSFSSTMLGQAILPAIFHQDPRYFVKGTGTLSSRALYAIATTVICKGDNRHWQLNYSNIVGNVASAGISNLYYPATDRHGAGLMLQNSMVTTALGAAGGLIQEFFLHRMTPRIPNYNAISRQ